MFVLYKIADAFVSRGLNLRRELVSGNFNFIDMAGTIKSQNFADFLRQYKVDVDELRQERLDLTFNQSDNREMYNVKELIEYANLLSVVPNLSIFDKSQESFRGLLTELMDFLIRSSFVLPQREESCTKA